MNRMKSALILSAALLVSMQIPASAQSPSACHVFIDDENIWTLEIDRTSDGTVVPLLNIIAFTAGRWDLRPEQIQLYGPDSSPAQVREFWMETGAPDEPYIKMRYLAVLGDSFIPLELVGDFNGLDALSRVAIDLGRDRFELAPLDCGDYDQLAGKIDRVNLDSPDLWEDFRVLGIEFVGKRLPRPE